MSRASIENEPGLLRGMMADMDQAPDPYKPDPYWQGYIERFTDKLFDADLNVFRRFGSGLRAFGGGSAAMAEASIEELEDLAYTSLVLRAVDRLLREIDRLAPGLGGHVELLRPRVHVNARKHTRRFQKELALFMLENFADEAPEILDIEDSLLGNPSDIVEFRGNTYGHNTVKKIQEYVHARSAIDFEEIGSVLELGGGYGAQLEVLLKLDPNRRACLVEIPPQLYVAQQYLGACFPSDVCKYHEAREHGVENVLRTHRIVCLAPWQLPDLPKAAFDLFWNAASFQEMHPDTVQRYAQDLQPAVRTNIYLHNARTGDTDRPRKERTQASFEEIRQAFGDFELIWDRDAVRGHRKAVLERTTSLQKA